MGKQLGRGIRRAYFPEVLRGEEEEGRRSVGEFEFIWLDAKLGLFFVLFAIRDLFAKGTGMFAIEGPFDGLRERRSAEIFSQHGGPRDRLEHKPMGANG